MGDHAYSIGFTIWNDLKSSLNITGTTSGKISLQLDRSPSIQVLCWPLKWLVDCQLDLRRCAYIFCSWTPRGRSCLYSNLSHVKIVRFVQVDQSIPNELWWVWGSLWRCIDPLFHSGSRQRRRYFKAKCFFNATLEVWNGIWDAVDQGDIW